MTRRGVFFTQKGVRFALGYDAQSYGIWDLALPGVDGPAVVVFPKTEDGWRAAAEQFSRWEQAFKASERVQDGGKAPAYGAPPAVTAPPAGVAPPTASAPPAPWGPPSTAPSARWGPPSAGPPVPWGPPSTAPSARWGPPSAGPPVPWGPPSGNAPPYGGPPPAPRQSEPKIYTRRGDQGSTALYHGGRVTKDAPVIEVNGAVDEAQAALGMARALCERASDLDGILVSLERDLWVLMAEVATAPEERSRLVGGKSLLTREMVEGLEVRIDDISTRFAAPKEFVVPGQDPCSAALDVARTLVRRAERIAVGAGLSGTESLVVPYLNRLSDLVWTLARWREKESLPARER